MTDIAVDEEWKLPIAERLEHLSPSDLREVRERFLRISSDNFLAPYFVEYIDYMLAKGLTD